VLRIGIPLELPTDLLGPALEHMASACPETRVQARRGGPAQRVGAGRAGTAGPVTWCSLPTAARLSLPPGHETADDSEPGSGPSCRRRCWLARCRRGQW
jgi:hypothetical protein